MAELPKVYLVRAGANGEDEEYALDNSCAIIGYREYPSLEGTKEYDEILKIVTETKPELKPRAAGNYAGQLWAFAVAMKEGDIVVLPRKLTSQVALGKVAGAYKYVKVGSQYRHTRAVRWIRPDSRNGPYTRDKHSGRIECRPRKRCDSQGHQARKHLRDQPK